MKETKKSFWEKLALTQNNSCCSPKPETEEKKKEEQLNAKAKEGQQEKTENNIPRQNNCCG